MSSENTRDPELLKRMEMTEKLANAGILAAGIAHDINNPLTVILGLSRALQEDERIPADARAMLEKIAAQAERAGKITRTLLDFSGKREIRKRRVTTSELFERLETLAGYELKSHAVTLKVDRPDEELAMHADLEQLEQVMLNLMLNAEHAMAQSPVKDLCIGAQRAGDRVILSVADTGPGVPADKREKIFEPFFTTKPPGKGTGLGLSICYSIIAGHGGTITLKSPNEGGALFRIELPAA